MKKGLLHGTLTLLVIAAVVWWMNRGGEEPPPPEDNRPPTEVVDGGTIRGVVGFEGAAPKSTVLAGTGECPHLNGTDAGDVLIRDGKMQNAVVWISKGLESFVPAPDKKEIKIDQVGCMYVPRIAAAQVGQPVVFRNGESINHNVHVTGSDPAAGFSLGTPLKNDTVKKRFPKEDLLTVTCDLHKWMKAYLRIVPHGYFSVTGPDGGFSLPPIPPGTYTIRAWHERLGEVTQDLEVKAKEEKEIRLIFKK